ncbi:MAG: periplasmic heavy metal sensor [Desulfovibrionaceae bacterium]|nr:periplasmic heavy metal sensor [Desulfovibrionaceae bacterium]
MKSSRVMVSFLVAAFMLGSASFASEAYSRSMNNMGCPAMGGDMAYGMHDMGMGHGMGRGMGMGPRGAYSAEQLKAYDAIVASYRDKLEKLQEAMFVQRHELNALENATTPDTKAVRNAVSELYKLRSQSADLHQEMRDKIQKEVGAPANRPEPRQPRGGAHAPAHTGNGHY